MSDVQLLPCPFCEGSVAIEHDAPQGSGLPALMLHRPAHYGKPFCPAVGTHPVDAWNRRAALSAPRQEPATDNSEEMAALEKVIGHSLRHYASVWLREDPAPTPAELAHCLAPFLWNRGVRPLAGALSSRQEEPDACDKLTQHMQDSGEYA